MAQPESLRLLHYVNQLREESDQAMKALQVRFCQLLYEANAGTVLI